MPTTTVRLPEKTRATLRELSKETGEPMSLLLQKAVEAYRRQCIFQQANAAYAALRSDPEAWAEELTERQKWEGTLGDDLAEAKA